MRRPTRFLKAAVSNLDGQSADMGALSLSTVPPSLNNLFVNGKRGRFKSPEYKTWQAKATIELWQQHGWHVAGPIRVRLTFNRARTRADLDNLQKPILDVLMAAGRISDDQNVVELHSCFGAVPGTHIEIWSAEFSITPHRASGEGET